MYEQLPALSPLFPGPALPVPGLPDALVDDQGRDQLRGHDSAEGARAHRRQHARHERGGGRAAHLPSRLLEGKRII